MRFVCCGARRVWGPALEKKKRFATPTRAFTPKRAAPKLSNPLGGRDAWCGDPQPYLNSIVDVSAYAGQTVQFRFRLGTDSSVGRPDGWNIDDVVVQSCEVPTAVQLSTLSAGQSLAPAPLTLPAGALPAAVALALAAGAWLRKRR